MLPVLMLAAIIFTANHYVVDAIIGGAIVLAALGVVRFGERWFEAHPTLRRARHQRHA
jgi:hypothetical protein